MVKLVDFSKYKKKEASEPLTHEKENIQEKPILEPQKIFFSKNTKMKSESQISSFVGMRNISHTPTTDITEDITIEICPSCNKRYKITQDKSMNKDSIIDWFIKYLTKNKQNFTLDWLRGQKLTFESVNEMRKP